MNSRDIAIRLANKLLDMVYEDVNDHVRTTFCDDRGDFYNCDVEELYRVIINCIENARQEAINGTTLDNLTAQTSTGEPNVLYKYVQEEKAEPDPYVLDSINIPLSPDIRFEVHDLWLRQLQARIEKLESK